MSDVSERMERAILSRKLLSDDDRLLVAVSGGVDSMVLLHILHDLAAQHHWSLVVAHFNHELRGSASYADENFVRRAAERLGLPFEAGRADIKSLAKRTGLSIEMAARQARHGFLAGVAAKRRIRKVALAHHADDQVELFFLRILRGAGLEGLSGMNWVSPSPADVRIQLVRPLLNLSRRDIVDYARQERISFRDDATNTQIDYDRNRIRHILLPLLRNEFQTAVEKPVLRLMEIVRAESEFVESRTAEARSKGATVFDALPLAIQRRWLRSECLRLGIAPDFDLVERLRLGPGQVSMTCPDRLIWRDERGNVHTRAVERSTFNSHTRQLQLDGERGRFSFESVAFSWRIEPWQGWSSRDRRTTGGCERFDADKVGRALRLRHWQPGDRFQPTGMRMPVKLQDLFTNLRVLRTRRSKLLVAEGARGGIFWIEGLRISERFKLDDSSKQCLVWRWRRFSG